MNRVVVVIAGNESELKAAVQEDLEVLADIRGWACEVEKESTGEVVIVLREED